MWGEKERERERERERASEGLFTPYIPRWPPHKTAPNQQQRSTLKVAPEAPDTRVFEGPRV